MKRKRNNNHIGMNLNRSSSLMTLSMYKVEDKNLKPVEEWIYGTLNRKGNNSIINFKNQKTFNGYQKNRIDLYKLTILLIYSF